jgi:hypothetical protein
MLQDGTSSSSSNTRSSRWLGKQGLYWLLRRQQLLQLFTGKAQYRTPVLALATAAAWCLAMWALLSSSFSERIASLCRSLTCRL